MNHLSRFLLALVLTFAVSGVRAAAHPSTFSFFDLHIGSSGLDGVVVLHDLDIAQELQIDDPSTLADPAVVDRHRHALASWLTGRLEVDADGRRISWALTRARPRPDLSAVELTLHAQTESMPGRMTIVARLFPNIPAHQTLVKVYEEGRLVRQEILDAAGPDVAFYTGAHHQALAVMRTFVASGIHHIAIGPDHILFIVGLLLLGGTLQRLLLIVSAFTIGHSITLTLATLGILNPSASIVEPAIALSIVYVGADNLITGDNGRDVRAWVALFFGLVHGFGFAGVLRETGLPPGALGLSLFSFNLGVEIGQAAIVAVVAVALAAVRSRRPLLAQRVVIAGSILVTAAGAYWFLDRVTL
jgi:hydrogenase/urease accessory protein HupE